MSDVGTSCQAIINIVQYYGTILGTHIQLYDKSDKLTTQLKSDVDVLLSISQAGMYRRVLINAVGSKDKFKNKWCSK